MRIQQNNNVAFGAKLDISGLKVSKKTKSILEKEADKIGKKTDCISYELEFHSQSWMPGGVVGDTYSRTISTIIADKGDILVNRVDAIAGHKPEGEVAFLKNYLKELNALKKRKDVSNIEK